MGKKKAPEMPPAGAPAWMATYGDLVTLLLCFFVLLFATSSVDVAKYQAIAASFNSSITFIAAGGTIGDNDMIGSGMAQLPNIDSSVFQSPEEGQERQEKLEKLSSDFKTYFAENNLSDDVDVVVEDNYVKITFGDGLLFDSGSADLKVDSMNSLDIIATELMNNSGSDIKIEGHTDNVPIRSSIYPDNIYLSAARSISVLNYFKDVHGIEPRRMSQEGFGEYRPIASNDTPEGRGKNRRVEIKVLVAE